MNNKVIEILQYELKKGTGKQFHKIMTSISVPLHRSQGIDVVSFGNSLHNQDCYYLIRAFKDMDELSTIQDRFYKSAEWINGPRTGIIEKIDKSVKTVIEMPVSTIDTLRTE
ncbi:NIPSNAP family protein [Xenorhabdus sp. DI]|uniref:NIPSNAP family protein n=1 Tax=Xenorhabdus doucetiae TaxID=351671 RepID=UPI0019ABE14C|nr:MULTISPECIES: NIPSNAP family protein [unclassified Xenorhabdus]MBD2783857.1 NIPSNAP family protein [Xenorhabdus sp. 3]MBD2788587.1 NIPSNAP family protein [Xenorhabdus sp. DI]